MPYISLWYKKNVAVFQPDIHGVRLSPIADFTFLKDLSSRRARRAGRQRRHAVDATMARLVACRAHAGLHCSARFLTALAATASGRYDPRLRFQTISTPRFDIHITRAKKRRRAAWR